MRLSIRWKVTLGSLLAVTCGLAVAGLLAMQSLEQQEIAQLNDMLDARSNLVEYSLRSTFLNPPAPDQQTHLGIIVRQLGDRALARVTVVTADEIKDRQFQDLNALIETGGWRVEREVGAVVPTMGRTIANILGRPNGLFFILPGAALHPPAWCRCDACTLAVEVGAEQRVQRDDAFAVRRPLRDEVDDDTRFLPRVDTHDPADALLRAGVRDQFWQLARQLGAAKGKTANKAGNKIKPPPPTMASIKPASAEAHVAIKSSMNAIVVAKRGT